MYTELRAKLRYPLRFPLRYSTKENAQDRAGETRDFSSHGIYVESAPPFSEIGTRVRITIHWPDSQAPNPNVDLVIVGRVSRIAADGFAVTITRHEFILRRGRDWPWKV